MLEQGRERTCTVVVELIELDLQDDNDQSRFVVACRRQRWSGDRVISETESTLTAVPCTLAVAHRRAVGYLLRRLAVGDVLREHAGFPELQAVTAATAAAPAAFADPLSASVPAPDVAALVQRFSLSAWRLLPPARQARSVWRVAERSDAATTDLASQQALRALAPRLVSLLGSSDDLLDYCLAVALGRLDDTGARAAMGELAERGRSPATRRMARQAWLLLAGDDAGRKAALQPLAARWQARGAKPETAAASVGEYPQWLLDGYDLALIDSTARQAVHEHLRTAPLEAGCFAAVRAIYKTAELRRDAGTLALLHARFESTPAQGRAAGAYAGPTRAYLRARGLRTLRRLQRIGHSAAPELAVALLLQLDDELHARRRKENRWQYVDGRYATLCRHYDGAAGWLLVSQLLLPHWPALQASRRSGRWWTLDPLDLARPPAQRVEGGREMWDANPQALVALALHSHSSLVQWVAARALQDHVPYLADAPATSLGMLLASRYPHTAAVALAAVRHKLAGLHALDKRLPLLIALTRSSDADAVALLAGELARAPAGLAGRADFVAALLLSPQATIRVQGQALALLAPPAVLLGELLEALLPLDDDAPALPEIAQQLQDLLAGALAAHAASVPPSALHSLLLHPALAVTEVATVWLVHHRAGLASLPPATLHALLASDEARRCACGVRLLAALPDTVLQSQSALLAEFALHADAGVRAAVAVAIERLALAPDASRGLAEHLHAALFRSEAAHGLHDDLLRWLTGPLAAAAPARDARGCWRSLQARTAGAQRYGAWTLAQLADAEFSLRQWATLLRHADVAVRQRAMRSLDAQLGEPLRVTPEQAAQLLPVANSTFEDTQRYARQLLGERLPEASLTPELLIAWVDHPQAWVQALGRARLTRRMRAPEASLCLLRLAQHPGNSVQLFVTQWLLELPAEADEPRAERLRQLQPYFLTVLSQVHRARAAKSRIVDFLRQQVKAPACAAVVADIFARQVVGASLTDQPQYVAGLRDIAARHPGIVLPFLEWVAPEARGAHRRAVPAVARS